ncbi:hypothetical protein CHUAL_008249 [Chamberlinius hualienensis]
MLQNVGFLVLRWGNKKKSSKVMLAIKRKCNWQMQKKPHSTKFHSACIIFECEADLVQLANQSRSECHEIVRNSKTANIDGEAANATESDIETFDEATDGAMDGTTTESVPETSGPSFRRSERRRRRKERFMLFNSCLFDKIQSNAQVQQIKTQCEDKIKNNHSEIPTEKLLKKTQFCTVGTVFKNCLPGGQRRRGGGPGFRRRFANRH